MKKFLMVIGILLVLSVVVYFKFRASVSRLGLRAALCMRVH